MDASRREVLFVAGRALLILPAALALWFVLATPLAWVAGKVALLPIRVASDGLVRMELAGGEVAYTAKLEMPYRPGSTPRVEAEVQVNAALYTYGIAFFIALVLAAAESRRNVLGALAGVVVLLLLPAVGIAFDALKQLGSVPALAPFLGWGPAMREFVALGYQVGSLLLPTLGPVAFWLYLARGLWSRSPAPG